MKRWKAWSKNSEMCDDCKEQPAVVHLTQIANGQKMEIHLCLACANRRSIQIWPVIAIPSPGFKPSISAPHPSGYENRSCGDCGYGWRDFLSTGFLGCTRCYQSFGDLLSQIIAKNHGPIRHQGKFPQKGAGTLRLRREIAGLRAQLEKAVTDENFEKAAELRDEIRNLEQTVQ